MYFHRSKHQLWNRTDSSLHPFWGYHTIQLECRLWSEPYREMLLTKSTVDLRVLIYDYKDHYDSVIFHLKPFFQVDQSVYTLSLSYHFKYVQHWIHLPTIPLDLSIPIDYLHSDSEYYKSFSDSSESNYPLSLMFESKSLFHDQKGKIGWFLWFSDFKARPKSHDSFNYLTLERVY